MGKKPKVVATEAQANEAVIAEIGELLTGTPPVVKAAAQVQVLRVKAGMPFRGARKAWYELLTQYDGKPAADFLAAATAERPSKYGARSKHCGQAEPVAGWFRFFLRVGAARVE
jgi:hypothetical protein